MSFNLADKPLAERAALEDEKSRLFELWQNNLGKAKGEAARLFGERAKRKGKWAGHRWPLARWRSTGRCRGSMASDRCGPRVRSVHRQARAPIAMTWR